MIRGAFKRAALRLDQKGKGLSGLIEKELEERPLETLRAIQGFIPKEMMIEHGGSVDIKKTLDEYQTALDFLKENSDAIAAITDKPVEH